MCVLYHHTPYIYIYIYIYTIYVHLMSHIHITLHYLFMCLLFSRFEKLDITPKSAQKLKPVLERWLVEAELWIRKVSRTWWSCWRRTLQEAQAENQLHTAGLSRSSTLTLRKTPFPLAKRLQRSPKRWITTERWFESGFVTADRLWKNTSKINMFQVQ